MAARKNKGLELEKGPFQASLFQAANLIFLLGKSSSAPIGRNSQMVHLIGDVLPQISILPQFVCRKSVYYISGWFQEMIYEVYGKYVEGLEKDSEKIPDYFGRDFAGLSE